MENLRQALHNFSHNNTMDMKPSTECQGKP